MPFDMPSPPPAHALAPRRGARHALPRRSTLILDHREGTVIAVESGCLWITMERDPRDIVLVAGMRFEIDRSGRTVVAAEEDSRFRLFSTPGWRDRAFAWGARLVRQTRARWSRDLARGSVPYF